MDTLINKTLDKIFKKFGDKYFIGDTLNKSKVIQAIDRYDKELLEALLANKIIKENFTIEILGNIVFETNKLIELFEADEYWEDSYTKYSKKIGLTVGGKFIDDSMDVVLDFPYKDTVLKASMSKEDTDKDDLRPDEPFLNEIIAREEIDVLLDKKILVNAKKYDEDGEHEVDTFDENDNLILKGNNLLALHTLKEKYDNKIKMIYIDPPYNTGNDSFKYNDKFNRSTWLTFIKNRLETTLLLLGNNGVIFVQCDDNEQAYLKIIMDEIYGEENYIATLVWENKEGGGKSDSKFFRIKHEYILVYAKNKSSVKINGIPVSDIDRYTQSDKYEKTRGKFQLIKLDSASIQYSKSLDYPIKAPDGSKIFPGDEKRKASWRWSKSKLKWGIKNDYVVIKKDSKNKWAVYTKQYLNADNEGNIIKRTLQPLGVINKYSTTQSNRHIRSIFDNSIFKYSKPEELMKYLLEIGSNEGDLILDFFMGSSTTQSAAHKINRSYIGIEQMDYINTVSVPRLQKVIEGEQGGISKDVGWQGGGSFVYAELMEKNRGFIEDIRQANTANDIRKVMNFLLEEAEIDFRVDLEKIKNTLHELPIEDQKKILFEIIDKNQLYYNYSEIDDENVRDLISEKDYKFNQSFYKKSGDE